ncbi:MAG: tetratricopeptide repeat protein [Alphaproteobacteria bacterium]|nr:tetratricopeptide repeat protein [Alphaproteobacteria bacterium]
MSGDQAGPKSLAAERFNEAAARHASGQMAEAEALYRAALELQPDHVEALGNLAAICAQTGRVDEAETQCRRALALRPHFTPALNTLGIVLRRLNRLDEAVEHYQRAVALDSRYAEAFTNLGLSLRALGQHDEAIAAMRRVVTLQPESADAHMSLASTLLMTGDFAEGWREYEWRWKLERLPPPPVLAPPWTLDAPRGSSVLLNTKQGFGDTIQFTRFAPLLVERGHRVVLEVREPLCRLLEGALPGVEIIVRGAKIGPVDRQIALMSVPRVLGTTLNTIPANVPYLAADAGAVARWRARLDHKRSKIGLVWRGSATHGKDRARSLDPALLAPIFGVDGVQLVSLQKVPRPGDLDVIPRLGRLEDWTAELDDFAETAALIAALDLVITVDTSVAHLAGALAKPFWVMLPHVPDWRWLLAREDSPWYPTARLFRQTRLDDWEGVIQRVGTALIEWWGKRAP